jgi:hypothetical protein
VFLSLRPLLSFWIFLIPTRVVPPGRYRLESNHTLPLGVGVALHGGEWGAGAVVVEGPAGAARMLVVHGRFRCATRESGVVFGDSGVRNREWGMGRGIWVVEGPPGAARMLVVHGLFRCATRESLVVDGDPHREGRDAVAT